MKSRKNGIVGKLCSLAAAKFLFTSEIKWIIITIERMFDTNGGQDEDTYNKRTEFEFLRDQG